MYNFVHFPDMTVFKNQTERTVEVNEGDAAIIDLGEIESKPSPDVSWQSDEGDLGYAQKYATSKTNQLIILSTDQSDQRPYRARAVNAQVGKVEHSAYTTLIVNKPSTDDIIAKEIAPEIIIAPKDVQIVKGTSGTVLDCIANARPLHELETLWYKDGILIENAGITYSVNDNWNRSLTLVSLNTTHSGRYECNVNLRSGGFPTVKASAQVMVLEKPWFVSHIKPDTLGNYGAQITLSCDVDGIPKPNVTWYRNNEELDLTDTRYILKV